MKHWFLVTSGLVVLSAIAVSAWPPRDPAVVVDPTRTYQTMKGWEVTARFWEEDKANDRYDPSWRDHQAEILHRLVNELGIDRVRIEIKSGAENPIDYWGAFEAGRIGYRHMSRHRFQKLNDDGDPDRANPVGFHLSGLDHQVKMLLPIQRLVRANGEKLFVTLTYVDFKRRLESASTVSHAQQPAEYAELVALAFDHLRKKHGVVPDAFEVILEPDNTEWRGPQIGAGLMAAIKRLRAAGFSPQIILPSTAAAAAAPEYFDQAFAVPGVDRTVTTFAYHRYDSNPAAIGKTLPHIAERAKRFGLDTAMLEYLQGGVEELHDDLTKVNVSSWQQWAIATNSPRLAERGGYYYLADLSDRAKPMVQMAPRTRELAQYFRFVRAGAVRIGASSNDADTKAVAFRNADGRHVVVVQTNRGGTISVTGVPAATYGVRYTTATETGRDLSPVRVEAGQPLTARLPAKGVITFHQHPAR